MKYSPDLLKAVDHCQNRSYITNRYTGHRIAVDCGQCDYCIHKRAKKASMRVRTAGSAFKYSYFVTLTYDNEHVPLMNCEVLHSEYEDTLSISGDKVFGYERHSYIPVSEYQPEDSSLLRHIFFTQVQGTVPFDRGIKEYVPVKDNWFLSMDAIRSFIRKTQAVDNSVYPVAEKYGINNLIPFLNYVDVQNYIKRLRKHLSQVLGSYETLHFYAVGEYGPVHFRPHYHILLFTNSKEVSEVLRQCHDKSWKLGRSDFQIARGGASSYVASYVNSLSSAPLLYRSCRAFRPRQRASLGFFEKGEVFEEGEDVYHAIEQKIDSVINGRIYNFNGISVKSTPPMSYIRTLLPRFSSARYDDATAIARIIRAVADAPKRIARFGIVAYDSDSILSIVRAYYKYLMLTNNDLTNEDEIILHASRCSTRCCFSSVDFDTESYVNKLYRLFLYVSKFLRNWHLPSIGGNLDSYASRIIFIIKTGLEYEKKKDYQNLRDSYMVRAQFPDISDSMFVLPQSGAEIDSISSSSSETFQLLDQLRIRSATFCRNMIKHKKLNDANNIFNRMV
jgi:hypothetical protein